MAINSEFLLYEGSENCHVDQPRTFLKYMRCSSQVYRRSPLLKFSIPPGSDGEQSSDIYWCIVVFGNTSTRDNKPLFEVKIETTTNGKPIGKSVGIKCSLAVQVHCNGGVRFKDLENQFHCLPADVTFNKFIASWGIEEKEVPSDCRRIQMNATYQAFDLADHEAALLIPSVELPNSTLERLYTYDLTKMLNKDRLEGRTTDLIIKLRGKEFRVHRCVLAVKSNFFKAQLGDIGREPYKLHVLDIVDQSLTPELFETLLSSVYTGHVKNWEIALDLLPLTQKYRFKKLKEICESVITTHLTTENVLRIYVTVQQCDCDELRKKCIEMVTTT